MKTDEVYINDIWRAIAQIEEYVKGIDFENFDRDRKTQDAVIRQTAIIGEAMGKLSENFLRENSDIPVKEAVAMRNVLVHDYDWIDTEELWKTLERDLPELKQKLQRFIK